MSTSPKLAKNTMYYTMAMVAVKAISFIYFTIVAKSLGVEGTGVYFLALAVTMVFQAVTDFGLTSVLIREIAKTKEDAVNWVRNIIGLKLFTIPLAAVLTYFAPILLGYDEQLVRLVHIAIFIMIADAVTITLYGVMRGLQNLKYESIGIFIGQSSSVAIGAALIMTDNATLEFLVLALLFGSLFNVAFSTAQIVRHLGWGALKPKYSMSKKALKMSFAFFLASVFVKIYSYVDSIILSKVIGEAAVGEYAVAYKLTYAFQFLPMAFVAALYPTMSAQANDKMALKKTLLNSFWYLSFVGFPIIFGIWAIAPEVIRAFYSTEFENSILTLQVLIFALLPIFLDFPIGSLLNATNRQHIKTAIMGMTMVINVALNLILIPIYGVVGASIAAIVGFTFMFGAGWMYAKKAVDVTFPELVNRIGGLFVAAVLMAVAVIFVKPHVHFALAIPVGAMVYIFVAFLLKAVTMNHINTLKRLLSRKTSYAEENITPDS